MNNLSLEGAGPPLGPFVSYLKCSLHNGPRVQWRRHARAKSESSKTGQMQRIGKAGRQKNAACLRFNLPRQRPEQLSFSSPQVDALRVFALLHMGDLKRKHALFFMAGRCKAGHQNTKRRAQWLTQPKGAPHPKQTRMSVVKPPSRVSSAAREGLRCSRKTPCRSSRLYSTCRNSSACRADVSDTRFPP